MSGDGQEMDRARPANDNARADGQASGTTGASERLDRVVLSIARLIGRQIAREHFASLEAANDNRVPERADAHTDNAGDD